MDTKTKEPPKADIMLSNFNFESDIRLRKPKAKKVNSEICDAGYLACVPIIIYNIYDRLIDIDSIITKIQPIMCCRIDRDNFEKLKLSYSHFCSEYSQFVMAFAFSNAYYETLKGEKYE